MSSSAPQATAIPKLELETALDGMSISKSKKKLLAAKIQDDKIVDVENRVLVRKISENLVSNAFNDVAREIWLNTPRKP
jgi:hypothetical protein